MSWSDLSQWWLEEVSTDPAYESVVTPLLLEILEPRSDLGYLDLGSGEGRLMRTLGESGTSVIGIELNRELAQRSATSGHVVVDSLPDLASIAENAVDGAFCVLVLEHIADGDSFFSSVARVVRPGGILAVVSNHPAWTAPESTPITDEDGEVLWRPGGYFSDGVSDVPAGDAHITFHHRSMATLLNAAANVGWSLETMIERPHHEIADQSGIPRLLACRWQLVR